MDAVVLQELHQQAVLQVRMDLDLVGGDRIGAEDLDRLAGLCDGEVGDADLLRQALCLGLGQCGQVLLHRHVDLVVRRRPVDQCQVDMVGAQLLQAGAQAGQQRFALELGDPDLGGQVDLIARHTGVGNGLADLGFIAVDLCGIDGAVADIQRVAHGVDHGLVFEAEGAETEGGDSHGELQQRGGMRISGKG